MDNSFFEELSMLGTENSVDTALLVDKVKSAMLKAMKRAFPECEDNMRVDINPETKTFEMFLLKTVVGDDALDNSEINIDQARTIKPDAMVDDLVEVAISPAALGRTAAQSAKQSIHGDLRSIHRENILNKFADKEFECITAVVTQVEPGRGTITVMYDGTELYLFRNEQIPGEVLKEGQSVKVYVTGITNKEKKPIIKISRAHRDLVKRLFELEIPEIYDGTVEIKSISREAGSRTKLAVCSHDPNVDAIGACIGPKRARINTIVNELSGEKIDIIPYSDVPEEFIARALAPAEVLRTTIDDPETRACTVIVPNNQLSLAIGNRGQNAKLAAKLTGYKIDIKPEQELPAPTPEA